MIPEEIKKVLENHKHWLNEDCEGWGHMRADLYKADLYKADLYKATLRGADLRGADLCKATLYKACLREADLREATLFKADLREACLCGANLYDANLYGADLRGADLRGADLRGADLRGADLRGADLYKADLRGADICGADLREADLRGAENIPFIPMACPDSGLFIGWKKCNNLIVKLLIPEDALRSSATTRKCRCNKAKVLEIQTLDGRPTDCNYTVSDFDPAFIYTIGDTVFVDNFNTDRWNECASGIHFFINRQEAVEY